MTPITKHTIVSVFVGSYGQNVFILWSIGKGLRLESRESRFASLACNNCSVFFLSLWLLMHFVLAFSLHGYIATFAGHDSAISIAEFRIYSSDARYSLSTGLDLKVQKYLLFI